MTTESKILTVSYGTFSCTLEGFDNPFDTMKAIAEYFRELAAQDRHFGAEPPPPDAAMLHRLAEREVSRLAGTLPREDTALLDPKPAETETASGATPRIHINAPERRRVTRELEPTEYASEDEVVAPEPALQDVIPDGVAAKLARIRQSVQPLPAALAGSFSPFVAAPETAEREVAEPEVAEPAPDVAEATADVDAVEPVEILDIEEPVEEVAEFLPETAPEADTTVEVAAVAADLIEIEATSEAAETFEAAVEDTAAEADIGESWHEADIIEDAAATASDAPVAVEADEAIAAEMADAPSAFASDAAPDAATLTDETRTFEAVDGIVPEKDTAEDLAELAALDGVELDRASLEAAFEDSLPEYRPADVDLADALIQDPVPEADSVAETAAEIAAEVVPAAIAEEPSPATGKANGRNRRVSSRVVRLHPDADETEMAGRRDSAVTRPLSTADEPDEVARLMQQAEEVMAEDENRRRQEALSRLKAAVASTEADRADVDYEAPRVEANLDPYRDDLAEAIVPDSEEPPASPPEVRPRRKSVSVRPQEPRPGTIRPGIISPPPLVLVSEQRIDRVTPPAAPAMAPQAPGIGPSYTEGKPMVALRTGRLSGAIGSGAALAGSAMPARNLVLEKPSYGPATEAEEDEELSEDSKDIDEAGFATFAETVGARSMADLLEAAAAYATCVENRSQFTRPQLMRRMMASAGGNPVSREDGLRSFGTLLRTGRIEKVSRGHYSLAENSPYLAEARRLS